MYFLYSYDYLEIFEGDGTFLRAFCGEKHGTEIIVTGDYAQLIFHSDGIENRRGFNISFTVFPNFGEYYQYMMSQDDRVLIKSTTAVFSKIYLRSLKGVEIAKCS